jgi:hypothetical protein
LQWVGLQVLDYLHAHCQTLQPPASKDTSGDINTSTSREHRYVSSTAHCTGSSVCSKETGRILYDWINHPVPVGMQHLALQTLPIPLVEGHEANQKACVHGHGPEDAHLMTI